MFALVVTGMLNKRIASALGISEKTITVRRVRLADRVGVIPPKT